MPPRRQALAIKPRQRRCDLLGGFLGEQSARQRQIVLARRLGEDLVLHHALLVELADFIGLRRGGPDRIDAGLMEEHLGAAAA